MIRYYTFGDSAIEIEGTRLGPASSRAFAALLYLGVERDRRVARATLQHLLFPGANEANAAHSLRQLLYRLRQLAVPMSADVDSVGLLPGTVQDDYSALLEARRFTGSELQAIVGGFLPGYAPSFSEPFEEWCDGFRGRVTLQLRRVLVEQICEVRRRGDWREMERVARACLALDPLNEEGTLALAEALAMTGSKVEAVQLLNSYQLEIASSAQRADPGIGNLRARIKSLPPQSAFSSYPLPPLIERQRELAHLHVRLTLAANGRPQNTLMVGATGAGKSRLLLELSRSAALKGVFTLEWRCRATQPRQPLSVFSGLLPHMLRLPGALGCSPDSLQLLGKLTRPDDSQLPTNKSDYRADLIAANIENALVDLFQALSTEAPVLLLLDDVENADPASLSAVRSLLSERELRVHVVTTAKSRRRGGDQLARSALNHDVLEIMPLSEIGTLALLKELLPEENWAEAERLSSWCFALSGGNPLAIELVANHILSSGRGDPVSDSLTSLLKHRIDQLTATTRYTLQVCVALGGYCTLERLAAATGLTSPEIVSSVRELEEARLIRDVAGTLECVHDFVAQSVLNLVNSGTRRAIHYSIAKEMEPEAVSSSSAALLWACTEHWQLAGNSKRAVGLLRLCGRHAVEIGQPTEALEILRRAAGLADEPRERCELIREAMDVADLGGEWNAVCDLVFALRREPRLASMGAIDAAELEVKEGWALWRSGQAISDRRESLSGIATAPGITPRTRLSAAGLLLFLADRALDEDLANFCISIIRDLSLRHDLDTSLALRYQLVFEVVFGNPKTGVDLARSVLAITKGSKHTGERCNVLYNVGLALFRLGHRDEAVASLRECFELAAGIRSPTYEALAAAGLCLVEAAHSSSHSAREWHDKASKAFDAGRVRASAALHYSNCIDQALECMDHASAESWLAKAQSEYGAVQDGRSRLVLLAYQLLVRRLSDGTSCGFEHGDEILAGHLKARHLGMHDRVALAAMLHLCDLGKVEGAHQLRLQYERDYRRDLFPLPIIFSEI